MDTDNTKYSELFELRKLPKAKVLWLLFFNFLKIATFVLGGGYAIMIAAERVFVDKLHWLSKEEMIEMFALAQTVPGLMAGNIAIYIGYKSSGQRGALVALLGVALPSFVIIVLVSYGLAKIPLDNIYLASAFVGVRASLSGLVLSALIKIWQQTAPKLFGYTIIISIVIAIIFMNVNPAILIAVAILVGILKVIVMSYFMKRGKHVTN